MSIRFLQKSDRSALHDYRYKLSDNVESLHPVLVQPFYFKLEKFPQTHYFPNLSQTARAENSSDAIAASATPGMTTVLSTEVVQKRVKAYATMPRVSLENTH